MRSLPLPLPLLMSGPGRAQPCVMQSCHVASPAEGSCWSCHTLTRLGTLQWCQTLTTGATPGAWCSLTAVLHLRSTEALDQRQLRQTVRAVDLTAWQDPVHLPQIAVSSVGRCCDQVYLGFQRPIHTAVSLLGWLVAQSGPALAQQGQDCWPDRWWSCHSSHVL